ncbi:MAG: YajD family HNH nuclease [Gammaproteobacteria bacterium]
MTSKKTIQNKDRSDQIIAEARRNQELREQSYRGQALKLYPWICGRCGREFDHKNVNELTVHHKDHNHDNNPPDGSNWELLCLYCHDNEHSRYEEMRFGGSGTSKTAAPAATFSPFANLKDMMNKNNPD